MYGITDLDHFSDPSFDVKAWVNRACTQRPSDEPIDKFLAELEMKLQLSAEELEASLQEYTAQAMKRIPYAVQEVFRLQGDIQGMQDQVKSTLEQVARDKQQAVEAVAYVAELDRVKVNAESACSTLKEATELSDLFYKVEDVFASGDLPRVADMLATMRRSLNLVGDVPEFRAGKQKLAALEDRLQALVEGSFADALAANRPDNLANLAKILLAVDRYPVIESLYCNSRLTQVAIAFEATAGSTPDVAAGLAAFHSAFLDLATRESDWCAAHLPALRPRLLASLLSHSFDRVAPAIAARLAPLASLPALLHLQQQALAFSSQLQALLPDTPPDALAHALARVIEPLEAQVGHYPPLEARQLAADIAPALPPLPDRDADLESSLTALSHSAPPAFAALTAALDRCLHLTAGTELPALLPVLDAQLATYLTRLCQCAQATYDAHILPLDPTHASSTPTPPPGTAATTAAAPPTNPPQLSESDVTVILTLVSLAHSLAARLVSLVAHARAAVDATLPDLRAAAARGLTPPLSLPALRLHSAPRKLAALEALHDTAAAPDPPPTLPAAAAQLEAFQQLAHDAVLAALLAPVRHALHALAALPEWTRPADPDAILPAFNTYPLPHITAVGEYLMTLPQQLEVLVADDAAEGELDSNTLAAEWLDTAVTAAARELADRIHALPALTPPGAAQLAADTEYFCNVMSALQVAVPPALLAVLLLANVPEAQFGEAARGALADGGVDEGMVRAVARMRGLQVGEGQAAGGSGGGGEDASGDAAGPAAAAALS